jgi:hypothetical protein
MLSWHVMPKVDTDQKNWISVRTEIMKTATACFFPDFDLQGELLPYFETDKLKIDPYDGAFFEGKDLEEFA